MKNPKVSVVIPAYNHEKYVGEAIQSVLVQTFQDFELIVINDGSTDNTEAEVLKFKGHRIRYYSQENRGLSATLNRGIELARGEYFSFLPSDDLFYPDKIELQVKAFQEGGGDLGIVFSRQTVIDADGKELTDDPLLDWFNVPYRSKEEIFPALFEKNFLPAPTMMCRKECFDKTGGFDESLYYCQDYDMWLRMLKFYGIQIIEKPLLKYRWHGKNLTYTKTERSDFERAVLLLKAIRNLQVSDIFPRLKDLEESQFPQEYSASYNALAQYVLKSGLFELVPVAYSLMEEVWRLAPNLEIEGEIEELLKRRPHFLDLRDKRLGVLTDEVSELRFKLSRLYQLKQSLDERTRLIEGQEKEIEKQQKEVEKQGKEIEKKEEEIEKQRMDLKKREEELEKKSQEIDEEERGIANTTLQLIEDLQVRVKESTESNPNFLECKLNSLESKLTLLESKADARYEDMRRQIDDLPIRFKEITESNLHLLESKLSLLESKPDVQYEDMKRRLEYVVLRLSPTERLKGVIYRLMKRVHLLVPVSLREKFRAPYRRIFFNKVTPADKKAFAESNEIAVRSTHGSQMKLGFENRPSLPSLKTEDRDRVSLGRIKQPKVSIILPVYNQSYLLEEAIRSVLSQTYRNFELIIVNDGSTDRVNEILPRYGFHDKVIILNQENQGLPRALTNGFRYATGSFFTWTSADNIMLPNQVETLVDFLLRHPDVDMVYSNVKIIDDDGNPLLHSNYRPHNQYPVGSNQIYLPEEVETLGSIEDNFINASFLYRGSVGRVIGEYDPCLLGTEDYDYWLRINSLFAIQHLDSNEILYRYRVHTDSLSERYGKSDILENVRVLIRYHRERESYYNSNFDVILFGDPTQIKQERYYRFALEFRNQGHHVIWGIWDPDRAGERIRREGMVEIFIGKGQPERIKENLLQERQHPKALILLTAPFEKKMVETLKGENIFLFYDLKSDVEVGTLSLEFVDAISSKSQTLLNKLNEGHRKKSYLIKDGLRGGRILKKARDNFYLPYEYPINDGRTLLYYGPLKRNFFDRDLFHELVSVRKDWNFVLVGKPGGVEKDLVADLNGPENVHFLGEKPCENLYQALSSVSAIWAPVKPPIHPDGKDEEPIEKLIEIAGLSGRPLLIPDLLDFSEIPFVFPFKDTKGFTYLLDTLPLLKIDREIFERWIRSNSWKEEVKWFLAIANNRLFYRKTREPIKKERKLLDILPAIYRPPMNEGKVNVLIQVRSLDKGGLEEVIFNLLNHFDYRKISVLILCEEKGGVIADQCRGMGIVIKILGNEKEREYREILKKYSIGVVNPHSASFGMRIAHEMGIPVVPVIHNAYVWLDQEEITNFKTCDQYVSKYIAVSENVARYTIEKFGVAREKIQVIPNGLDVLKHEKVREKERRISRASLGINDQDFVFLNVATFDGRKGHHALVSAVKRIKENSQIKAVCVGNIAGAEYFSHLKERIKREGLEGQMILHDYVEEISSFYQLADAFVLPSLFEGWSISVMEAMFYGLPLILTDVGGNREIIKEVGNGILIPTSYGDILHLDYSNLGKYCWEKEPQNGEVLANAMKDFLTQRAYWKEMGERGKRAVQDRYSIDATAKAYEELFLSFGRRQEEMEKT